VAYISQQRGRPQAVNMILQQRQTLPKTAQA